MASATIVTPLSEQQFAKPLTTAGKLDHVQEQTPGVLKWAERISNQGPWNSQLDPLSYDGPPSLPMPVDISDEQSLMAFFSHLQQNGNHERLKDAGAKGGEPYYDVDLLEFEKGVFYADGRVDLCKMATGPPNIGKLMQSLETNTFAKHFLLGNNVIGPVGAKAIADFVNRHPQRLETWYLAGNCIDTASLVPLVDAMAISTTITNVWLKRNPLKAGSAQTLFHLITSSPKLRTLDLDQTELGDAGVAELFASLARHTNPVALRHIYLNGTGLGPAACTQISEYLANPDCNLESLYISNNPIGPSIASLAAGVKALRTLKRLSLQSCGLTDASTIVFLDALTPHPSLSYLDLGQSYSTSDLKTRYNWLTNACVPSLINLIHTTQSLQMLNLSFQPLDVQALNDLSTAVLASSSLLVYFAKPCFPLTPKAQACNLKTIQAYHRLSKEVRAKVAQNVAEQYNGMSYEQFEQGQKRFLISPKDVRYIDSVYRNRDAGLARRGLKRLEKWWGEGDETLAVVAGGEIGS